MYKSVFSLFFLTLTCFKSFSQKDSIIINQDPKLLKVLELKKIVNQEVFTSGQYTIQIFSGNFTDYKILMDKLTIEEKYNEIFYSFETPYYKIRVGKYVSRILASKELKKIKKDFSSAFILQPK
ncbi:SPOR domain-containing protein [Flavobacteriaceae bacterium]|nr:SPOR domain-containing protein [Flavobacteriaceae bacterium]